MHPFRSSLRWLRGAIAAALAAVDLRDLHFYGGLALFAFASSWRVAVVGAALALYAAVGGALVARLARRNAEGDT